MADSPSIQSSSHRLNCLIKGESIVFSVTVGRDCVVTDLKKEIKKERELGILNHIDPHTLELWKVDIDLKHYDEDSLGSDEIDEGEKLTSWKSVKEYWLDQPLMTHLHIIVNIPAPPILYNATTPNFSAHWSPRRDTVRSLYDVLQKERLVQVQGTPGCGKTTLMHLLHDYILKHSPSTLVYTMHSWTKPESAKQLRVSLIKRLREVDPGYPRQSGTTFLLFDEAQDTYEDHILWDSFFKGVSDGLYYHYRVVLFCNYDKPSSPRHTIGTPLVLRDSAHISLWPRAGSIGLLLNWSEFGEVVSRFEVPLNLHPDLLDLIFDWTVGHVGAVIGFLRMISYQKELATPHGAQFTLEAFYAENPTHKVVRALCCGAFQRGLPEDRTLLAQPDVVALFRTLLRYGAIDRDEKEDGVIRKYHRYGWIHADRNENGTLTRYKFPSPLHTVCLSWMLEPTNDMPHFTSLLGLALDALSKFKPSQLHTPIHRAGSMSIDTLPEPQYQDEFYRSVFSITSGNVRLSPEFTSARRVHVASCIDFVIPVVKWGIKITRDGSWLDELSSRFAESGAYEAWLKSNDLADYILLDCRTSIPRNPYSNIQNLFHVVFQDDYQIVDMYDNTMKLVKGPIVLQDD